MSDSIPGTNSTPAAPAASAKFVMTDTTTQGNWRSAYGADGYDIAQDPSAGNPKIPGYAQFTPPSGSVYMWSTNSTEVRNLQNSAGDGRIAAVWFTSNTLSFSLNLTDGQVHRLAVYVLDYDTYMGGRSERFDIIDNATGNVLDSQSVSSFSNGTYLVWDVTGNLTVQVTNLNLASNAVVNALFLGGPATPVVPPAPVVPTSATLTAPNPANGCAGNDSAAWTVTLDVAAPAGGLDVALASSNSEDVFHATSGGSTITSLTISQGATTGTFCLLPAGTGPRDVTIATTGLTVAGSPATYTAAAPTLAASPELLFEGTTTTVTFTGAGTKWTSSAPSFTSSGLSDVTVGAVTVTSDTTATAPITAGSAAGTVTFTDSTSGASTTSTVVPVVPLLTVVDFGSDYAGKLGSVGYTVYTYADGALTQFQARTTAGVAVQGSLCVAEFNAVPGGIYYIDWDSGDATPTHVYDYLDRGGYSLVPDVLDTIPAGTGLNLRQAITLVLEAFLSALTPA